MKTIIILAFAFLSTQTVVEAQWIKENVNTTASLRGLSVVNDKVVWASGTGGTVIRTINGGKSWNVITVPGAERLDFRDIEAFDSKTAYILSIGNGESSRIYKTIDGGKTWKLQFKNTDEKAFFDAIACWDERNCIAMSDPVNGKFLLLRNYWGDRWQTVEQSDAMARSGQAAFAASGTCLITVGLHHKAFLVTGGTAAEVMSTLDNGGHWDIYATQIPSGSSGSGIFSIAMSDNQTGVIVGGNYEKPDEHTNNLAFTSDGGKTWALGTGLNGYRSGVTYVNKNILIAVGTNGSDISYDGGKTWSVLDKENYNSVQSKGLSSTWAVGPNGRVALCPIIQLQKASRH
jgi:photosystem II stability/assembly factor-like uncharacterized protein